MLLPILSFMALPRLWHHLWSIQRVCCWIFAPFTTTILQTFGEVALRASVVASHSSSAVYAPCISIVTSLRMAPSILVTKAIAISSRATKPFQSFISTLWHFLLLPMQLFPVAVLPPSLCVTLFEWFLAPSFLGYLILWWLQEIESEGLPNYFIQLVRCGLYLLLFRGMYTFILHSSWWLLQWLLPPTSSSCPGISIIPDPYEGLWLTPAPRRGYRDHQASKFHPCVHAAWPIPPLSVCLILAAQSGFFRLLSLVLSSDRVTLRLRCSQCVSLLSLLWCFLLHTQHLCVSPSTFTVSALLSLALHVVLRPKVHASPYACAIHSTYNPPPPFFTPDWPQPSAETLLGIDSMGLYLPHSNFDLDEFLASCDDWWPDWLSDASDDLLLGRLHFISDLCSLHNSGFRFTWSLDWHSTVSILSYRERRKLLRRYHSKLRKSFNMPGDTSSVPTSQQFTFMQRVSMFVKTFNPVQAFRPFIPKQPLPSPVDDDPHVSIHLSSGTSSMLSSTLRSFLIHIFNVTMPSDCPLIIDTGASVCITPHASDFKQGTYRPSTLKVKDLSGDNNVHGEGIIQWPIKDSSGTTCVLELPGLHIETAAVRLLSPQLLNKVIPGSSLHLVDDSMTLCLGTGPVIPVPIEAKSNLPQIPLSSDPIPPASTFGSDTFGMESSLEQPWNEVFNVLQSDTSNLRPSQIEFLLWHSKLSHIHTDQVLDLMRPRSRLSDSSNPDQALHSDPIIKPKHSKTATCDTANIMCAACQLAKARRRTPNSHAPRAPVPPGGDLRRNHLSPGDCISCDHYVSPERGRRLDTFGKTTHLHGYTGGAIYVDHASGKLFHFPQVHLDGPETIRGKQVIEQEALDLGWSVKAYHSDNGIFSSDAFRAHCDELNQTLSFSAPGAKHQNGIAERAIGTVSRLARANIMHLMLQWNNQCDLRLWPLAMNYAVWVYNRLPNNRHLGGLSPNEIWSRSRSDHSELKRTHPFGCPVYVLDPTLQDGKKIPKWNSRARLGMFVGFSHEHSSLAPLVLNLQTGHISPQYHVIFDDKFETVPSLHTNASDIDNIYAELFCTSSEYYLDPDESWSDVLHPPSLSSTWNDPPPDSEGALRNLSQVSEGAPPTVPEGASCNTDSEGATSPNSTTVSRYPARSSRNTKPVYNSLLSLVKRGAVALLALPSTPAAFSNRVDGSYHSEARVSFQHLDDSSLFQSSWLNIASAFSAGLSGSALSSLPWKDHFGMKIPDPQNNRLHSLFDRDLSPSDSFSDNIIADIQPHALSVKARGNSEDNPSWDEAMKGPHQREYFQAAQVELHTLQNDLDCWELVERQPHMNVLPSTWAFKCKRFPDGRVKKFKARFCARGDRQKEGIDYFETWSPVVQWTTVRVMMILSAMLNLTTHQADITAAFVHAELPPEEEVYIHQPRGFYEPGTSSDTHVLRLKRSLYGLKQAPRHFFKYLASHLQKHNLKQSNLDPCLFIGPDMVVIVYVDDLLIYSKHEDSIDRLIGDLKRDGIWIRKEDSAAGFLGVDIQSTPNGITLTQAGLIDRIISALGLHAKYSTNKDTPADTSPLPKDSNGTPADPVFPYASIIGMLLYLSGHSRPDIAFAVHQCARYTFQPTHRHVTALKRIGRYLKSTRDKGLIMQPSDHLHVDCYPDADFAGLYNHEDVHDPHCVRSRTGYVILLAGCPVLWKSKLQTEIALSTMEAEYVALSQSCKDLFPVIDQVKELGAAVGLPVEEYTNLHTRVYEDNVGALTLAGLEPKRMTPRSKHYAIKYHWFRSQIGPRKIKLLKIDTKHQLGDIFTKGLSREPFQRLRSMLMGW